MKPNNQREALEKLYPSQKWKDKLAKMSDQQIHAIFMRMKSQNKI